MDEAVVILKGIQDKDTLLSKKNKFCVSVYVTCADITH